MPNKYAKVDNCLAIAISNLNYYGIRTLSSCCGHNRYPMTIIIKTDLGNIELFSGLAIHRKRKFYKKDSKGYYFIPEVLDDKQDIARWEC